MSELIAPALSPHLLKDAEFERTVRSVAVPPGIPLGSVQNPAFWAHCAKQLKPYTQIECRAQDNRWWALLMVATVREHAVDVWVLNYVDLEVQAGLKSEETYTVSFVAKQRWRVVRSDGAVVHKDCATEADARAWLAESGLTQAA